MRTSDFDYDLPRELIATHPAERRDESRLLVLNRNTGSIDHKHFGDLPGYLKPGDLLVMNDSRVMRARLRGTRRTTGAAVEALLLEPESNSDQTRWVAFCRPAKKFRLGEFIDFGGGNMSAQVVAEGADGERTLQFETADIMPLLDQFGEIPLPPYIVQRRKETEPDDTGAADEDVVRYQTVYARQQGSVAAPTAGLHFTPELLANLESRDVRLAWVTLHVGAGTFKPVEVEDPAEHPMHVEHYEVSNETAKLINDTKASGGRIIAVGTTTVRTLESAWNSDSRQVQPGRQSTRLLILPGYKFQVIDAMITNFHLPRSSLLMMISAFAGYDHVMEAYRTAISARYRFYSYGDAMLIS